MKFSVSQIRSGHSIYIDGMSLSLPNNRGDEGCDSGGEVEDADGQGAGYAEEEQQYECCPAEDEHEAGVGRIGECGN